jgi:uncharacterized protein YndB with AHSA1/START domain
MSNVKHQTKTERISDRELVSTRIINGPAELVFAAWTTAELFARWWVPKSCPIALSSCEMDVRVGGQYKLVFTAGDQSMAVFGDYVEVTPCSRLVWTNDEGGEGTTVITTVTFEQRDGQTLLTMHDLHPSKAALDEAIGSGSTSGTAETFEQLDELMVAHAK